MGIKLKITLTREQRFELRAAARFRGWCPQCNSESEFFDVSEADRNCSDLIRAAAHRSVIEGREVLCFGPDASETLDVPEIE